MRILLTILIIMLPLTRVAAADAPDEHDALRALQKQLVGALNEADIEQLGSLLTSDFQLHFADQTLITDLDALVAYQQALKERYGIASWNFTPSADAETRFPAPGVGIVSGSSVDTYRLADGREMELQSRWTATVVKQADGWKLTSAHASMNPFDNPIIGLMTDGLELLIWIVGAAAAVVGFLLGWLLTRRRKNTA